MSFDGGSRSQRARAAHHRPGRGTPSNTEHVEKIEEKNRMRPPSGPLKPSVGVTTLRCEARALHLRPDSQRESDARERIPSYRGRIWEVPLASKKDERTRVQTDIWSRTKE